MRKLFNGLLIACILAMFSLSAYAHKQVVVIPMGGDSVPVYEVGKTGPAGGIVFHVTDGGRHGLEAAHEDQSTGAFWGCTGGTEAIENLTSYTLLDPNTGAHNTQVIVNAGCLPTHAASVASSYMGPNGITTDWYLPNKEELGLLYDAKVSGVVGGFVPSVYWSSSQYNIADSGWGRDFRTVRAQVFAKPGLYRVRAVQAF